MRTATETHGLRVTLLTPEQVPLQFTLAALGSRLMAFILDLVVMGLSLFLVWILAVLAVGSGSSEGSGIVVSGFFLPIIGKRLGRTKIRHSARRQPLAWQYISRARIFSQTKRPNL